MKTVMTFFDAFSVRKENEIKSGTGEHWLFKSLTSKVSFQYCWEKEVDMLTVNRNNFKCCRVGNIKLGMDDIALLHVKVLVVNGQLLFFDMLLGIDTIIKPGELQIMESGNVCSPKHEMSLWTAIKTDVEFDQIPEDVKEGYECKLQAWLHNGWFQPYPKKKLEPSRGLIPLMVVVQKIKNKVYSTWN